MNILVIGFTNARFFNEYLKEEAESRGYTVDFCKASDVTSDVSNQGVEIRAGELDLKSYDVIHVGAISSNRWPLTAALGYLQKTTGCRIIDRRFTECGFDQYSGLSKYFLEFEHQLHLPRSIAFKRFEEVEGRIGEFVFPVIIKTNTSKQGNGVGLAKNVKELRAFVKKRLKQDEGTGFVLRERIPNDGDYRVNVVDGKAVICLKRTPKDGEFRSNISLGGTLSNVPMEEAQDICDAAEEIAHLGKYDIAGVDVMVHAETGDAYLLEVNRAPSGLDDDVDVSGVDLAGLIVDLYEKRVAEKSGYMASFLEFFTVGR